MQRNYCLPIIKSDPSEIQAIIRDNLDNYQFFEVWLDYVDNLEESFVQELVQQLSGQLVVLFRRQNLEPIHLPIDERKRLIKLLDGSLAMLDLDVSQTDELNFVKQANLQVKLITSYHNYDSTPDTVHLERIIATMEEYKPAIYKLAAQCESQGDALLLLQELQRLKAAGKPAIVLGMGEAGVITRVFGTLWGNEMTFAPVSESENSAPGQLTRQQLETIFNELGQ